VREARVVDGARRRERRDDAFSGVGRDAAGRQALAEPPLGDVPAREGAHGGPERLRAEELAPDLPQAAAVERHVRRQAAADEHVVRDDAPGLPVDLELDAAGTNAADGRESRLGARRRPRSG
jgi:hypothetical protein